ncbi:14081_t:CDS:1, partial [Ambispora leptoticha]
KKVSHIIDAIQDKIENSDAELIANTSDITFDKAEILKLNLEQLFTNNITL